MTFCSVSFLLLKQCSETTRTRLQPERSLFPRCSNRGPGFILMLQTIRRIRLFKSTLLSPARPLQITHKESWWSADVLESRLYQRHLYPLAKLVVGFFKMHQKFKLEHRLVKMEKHPPRLEITALPQLLCLESAVRWSGGCFQQMCGFSDVGEIGRSYSVF